jgi:hypothetical protein
MLAFLLKKRAPQSVAVSDVLRIMRDETGWRLERRITYANGSIGERVLIEDAPKELPVRTLAFLYALILPGAHVLWGRV